MWTTSPVTSSFGRWLPSRMSSAISGWRPRSWPTRATCGGRRRREVDPARALRVADPRHQARNRAPPGPHRPATSRGSRRRAWRRSCGHRVRRGRSAARRRGSSRARIRCRRRASAGMKATAVIAAATRKIPTRIRAASSAAQRSRAWTTRPSLSVRSRSASGMNCLVRLGRRVDLLGQPIDRRRAERGQGREADGHAEHPGDGDGRGGHAEGGPADGVDGGRRARRDGQAEAEPEHADQEGHLADSGRRRPGGHAGEADGAQGEAGDRYDAQAQAAEQEARARARRRPLRRRAAPSATRWTSGPP